MVASTWLIQLDGLHCSHTLELPSHGITAIFGASGSGKTSLLRALAGIDRVPGNISFNEQCWQSATLCLSPKQRMLAVAFQEPRLLPHKNVRDNIFLGRAAHSDALSEAIFLQLDIDKLVTKKAAQLSGGEQHRVALARALLQPSQALLLDEPLTGLDQHRRRIATELIKQAATKKPVLLVTHQLDELLALADHLVLMEKSASVAGTLDELINHPILIRQRGHECSILKGYCVEKNEHTSILDLGQGQLLRLVSKSIPESSKYQRLAVDARDVSICLSKSTDSSIMNILPANISHIATMSDGTCAISLNVAGQTLRALVSTYSVQSLALSVGKDVYAQIKGTVSLADN